MATHTHKALFQERTKREREGVGERRKGRGRERVMNKFTDNVNIFRVGAISKHFLTPNFKNK